MIKLSKRTTCARVQSHFSLNDRRKTPQRCEAASVDRFSAWRFTACQAKCGSACAHQALPPIFSASGSEIVKQGVIRDAARLRVDAICIQKRGLPAAAVVPCRAPCGYGDVSPTIRHAQRPQVYVASALSLSGPMIVFGAQVSP